MYIEMLTKLVNLMIDESEQCKKMPNYLAKEDKQMEERIKRGNRASK